MIILTVLYPSLGFSSAVPTGVPLTFQPTSPLRNQVNVEHHDNLELFLYHIRLHDYGLRPRCTRDGHPLSGMTALLT